MKKNEFILKMAYDDLPDKKIMEEFNTHYRAKGKGIYDLKTDVCLASCATAARNVEERMKKIA